MVKVLILLDLLELSIELRMVKNDQKCMSRTDIGFPAKQDQF